MTSPFQERGETAPADPPEPDREILDTELEKLYWAVLEKYGEADGKIILRAATDTVAGQFCFALSRIPSIYRADFLVELEKEKAKFDAAAKEKPNGE